MVQGADSWSYHRFRELLKQDPEARQGENCGVDRERPSRQAARERVKINTLILEGRFFSAIKESAMFFRQGLIALAPRIHSCVNALRADF